jgi:16S rRNA (guanine527-N7)-methyltransferase
MEVADLRSHFPFLTDVQMAKLEALPALYETWNAMVNVISRKDMEHFVERHVLHSLALTFYLKPKPGSSVIDIGTGGGFPGIPLAIAFPEVKFTLVDSIGKKIKVVKAVAEALELTNVEAIHGRVENLRGSHDYAVTRAVARLFTLVDWCKRPQLKIVALYCLKGGDLREEIEEIDRFPSTTYGLDSKLKQAFFETKKVVYVQLR